jgi:hypothetical protein
LAKNPGLTASQVQNIVNTAIQNNPGLTASDVQSIVNQQTQDLATKQDVANAVAGIKIPQGLTQTDVTSAITAYAQANPGLSSADVTKAVSDYMAANPSVTPDQLQKAMGAAAQETGQQIADVQKAITALDTGTQAKFDAFNDAQKAQALDFAKRTGDLQGSIDTVAAAVATYQGQTQEQLDAIKAAQEQAAADQAARDQAAADAQAAQNAILTSQVSGLNKQLTAQGTQQKVQSGLSALNATLPQTIGSKPAFLQAQPLTTGQATGPTNIMLDLKQLFPGLTAAGALGVAAAQPTTTQQPAAGFGAPVQAPQQQSASAPLAGLLGLMSGKGGDAGFNALSSAGLQMLGGQNALPGFASGGTVQKTAHTFITGKTGHYVKGHGDGQSDDIPAMLADGEYVFDADTVAALGNGSSDAGAAVLDKLREEIRKHKRSAPPDKIPPKAKSPLEYLKG